MTWTILEEVKENNHKMYKVQCDCGKIELRRPTHVNSGRTKSCKSCSAKLTVSKYPMPVNKTGCGGLSGTHYYSIKNSAKIRGITFDVTPEFLWELYQDQLGMCAISGIRIVLKDSIKNNTVNWDVVTASLDRIDSSKGYQPGNVWWVHKRVNRLKNDFSMDELLYWSQAIVKQHGNPEPSGSGNTSEGATTRNRVSRDSNIPTSAQPFGPNTDYPIPWESLFKTEGDDIV
jgi:hypothetical protein